MRTKHILTALAIPALFAACVADDFNEAVTGSDMAQRALLSEDFKLNFGGPETRFSAGEGSSLSFSYEVGDKIGGAIIDEYHPENIAEGESPYVVVPYVSTNHPFVLNEQGEWAIEHTMVEGNYLFYFPYNENNHARTAPMYSIPVLQDLSGKDGKFDPKAAVEKYSMGVGAQFLDKEDLSASLELVNIFGYLHLNIVLDNHYPDGNVDKIVIESPKSNGAYDENLKFALNGQLDNKGISSLFGTLENEGITAYEKALEEKNATTDFAITDTESAYYDEEMNEKSPVIVGKAPEGTALENIGQGNKGFETYLVIPATDEPTNGTKEVTIYLYTTEGDIYSGTVELGDFYVTRNKVRSVEVEVEKGDAVPYVVTSEADWNNNVKMLAKNEKATFIIAGNDFAITNNTKYPTNGATISVASDLKVTGNDVTIKNVAANKVIVENGAKLTTDGTFSAGEIENKGTVEFAVVYKEDKEDEIDNYSKVEEVNNEAGATLNILKDAIVTLKLNNKLDDKTAALNHGTVTVNGQATLSADSENNGDITITAGGSLRGQFTNTAEVIYPKGAKEEDIEGRYTPTITNNGEIYVTDGTVTNNGKIVNNDEISCSRIGTASFVNGKGGVIELGEKVQMLITDNSEGEIILNALDQTGWSVENAENLGVVSYKTKASDNDKSYDFSEVGTGITKLYVTGNLGVTSYGKKLNTIEVTASATLTLPKYTDDTPEALGTLNIKKGATVTAASEYAMVGILNVEKEGRLTINGNNEMVVNKVYNDGKVYVGGDFSATGMTEEEAKAEGDGEFRNTVGGKDGNIKFADEVMAEGELKTALENLYSSWLKNASKIGVGKTFDSWDDVTATKIADETTWTTTGWQKEAMDGVLKAAKIESMTLGAFKKYLKEDINAKVINDAIAKDKELGNKALEAKMKEKLTDNSWLGEDAYLELEAGVITKVEELEEDEEATTLEKGFKDYINNTFDGLLTGVTTATVEGRRLILSAGSYTFDKADVPAYSYAPAYAGTTEYDVLDALNQIATYEAENNAEADEKWFGGGKAWYTHDDFNELATVKNAVAAVVDNSETLTGMEGMFVRQFKLEDDALTVVKWNYTKATITALNALFE